MKAPTADLEIHVTTQKADGEIRLEYVLFSAKLGYTGVRIQGEKIRGRPDEYQTRLLGTLEQLGRHLGSDGSLLRSQEVIEDLEKLGHQLYRDLFPRELQDAYRDFRNNRKVSSLLIVSDEPWIPWELIKPYESEAFDDDFLCCRFELTRWLFGETSPEVQIAVTRVACIEAGNAPGGKPLRYAEQERRLLEALAQRHADVEGHIVADATYPAVARLLRRGGNGVIHFSGHGKFNSEDPDASRFFLVDGRPWRPLDLLDPVIERHVRRDRPLVFFASCEVAQQGWFLTRLGGWAARWILDGGCGAFIAPQWPVDDQASCLFVATFYKALERGESVAHAARKARLVVRRKCPDSPTWLAYTVYAHPKGHVRFGPVPTEIQMQCHAFLRRLDDSRLATVTRYLDPNGRVENDHSNQCQKLMDLTTRRGEAGWIDLQESILEARSPMPLTVFESTARWVQRPQRSWQVDGQNWVALGLDGIPWTKTPIRVLREAALLTWEGLVFRDGRLNARIWLPQLHFGGAAGLVVRYAERHGAVFAVLRGTHSGEAVLELWQREGADLERLASGELPPDALNRSQRCLWIELRGRCVCAGVDETGPIEARLKSDTAAGHAGVARFGPGVVRFNDLHLTVTRRAPNGRGAPRPVHAGKDFRDVHSTH